MRKQELEQKSFTVSSVEKIERLIHASELLLKGIAIEKFSLHQGIDSHSNFFQVEDLDATQEPISMTGGAMASAVLRYRFRHHRDRIFKETNTHEKMESSVGGLFGIPTTSTEAANLAGRNVASYRLAQLLKSELLPKTDFALLKNGDFGSCQVFARGEKLYEEEKISEGEQEFLEENGYARERIPTKVLEGAALKHPSFQKAMSNAHVVDFLAYQFDRNAGNFIYERLTDGGWNIHLIDNDLSYPALINKQELEKWSARDNSSLIIEAQKRLHAPLLSQLPLLIDQEMAEQVLMLPSELMKQTIASTGLTEAELQATEDRLLYLQDHLCRIESGEVPGGAFISNWNDKTFAFLTRGLGQKTSENYLAFTVDSWKEKKAEVELFQNMRTAYQATLSSTK